MVNRVALVSIFVLTSSLATPMWEEERQIASLAAKAAGRILAGRFGRENHVRKKGELDLVSLADLESEKTIIEILGRRFPDDAIVAEEAGADGKDSERLWFVDPLDGTTNFVHSFPFFAVSIALQVRQEVVLGTVYVPYFEEFFEAIKGSGAFLNGEPISVSTTRELKDSLLGTGFPYYVHENPERVLDYFDRMVMAAQGVRRPGAAAIDLCYVAAGRFDGFWEEGLKPWDTAAGKIIVEEAGGKLSTFSGGPYSIYESTLVAGNPMIHEAMLKLINP